MATYTGTHTYRQTEGRRVREYLVHDFLEAEDGLLDQLADRQIPVATRDEDGRRVEDDLDTHHSLSLSN